MKKNIKNFPFNRIIKENTIGTWIDKFEWEKHRLEAMHEKALDIPQYVAEFNTAQVEEEAKRTNHLNRAITAIQNIITTMAIQLDPQDIEMVNTITQLGYVLKTLKTIYQNGTIIVNDLNTHIKDWNELKERITASKTTYDTGEDRLLADIKTVDYFYEHYDTE